MHWMLAAILTFSGASVFTSCSDNNDNPAQEQAKNRKEFTSHTRSVLKELAENLNFESWKLVNVMNMTFNDENLNNPEFEKTIIPMFTQKVRETIRPLEAGSELAEKGYKYVGTVDLTEFNYRFTQRLDLTGFDVEEAEDFELVLQDGDWVPGEVYLTRMLLKAGGSSQELLSTTLSNDTVAVVMLVPETFEFTITTDYDEGYLTCQFQNKLQPVSGSRYAVFSESQWTIGGTVTTDVCRDEDDNPIADATRLNFSITQNPVTHKSDVDFSFEQNGKKLVELAAANTNANGQTDLSELVSSSSLLDLLAAVVEGNSIDGLTLTLLDDLTTTVSITDCAKALQIAIEGDAARRQYADEQTIDQYTQQLNALITAQMTCKGVNQQIPMRLTTQKFGVDYWTMPAFNFADENDYVSLIDLLDTESVAYGINIIDHAAEPMAQSIIVVRQLVQFLNTLVGNEDNDW